MTTCTNGTKTHSPSFLGDTTMEADFMDIKKYQIEVGKAKKQDVGVEEAIEKINEHEQDVTEAIQDVVNQ